MVTQRPISTGRVGRSEMGKRTKEQGQGLLELAVILPVLLILMIGLVEIGYALRDYLVVVNACREGGRFAARGRFADQAVGERVVSAGGIVRLGDPPADVPFLRTYGTDPNTAIMVTHIPMDNSGSVEPLSVTVYISGVVPSGAGDDIRSVWPSNPPGMVLSPDSKIVMQEVIDRHGPATENINATRDAAGYEEMGNHIVIVEVLFMHHPMWNNPFVPLPDPWMMHAKTEMRVVTDRGSLQ